MQCKENLDKIVLSKLKLSSKQEPDLTQWSEFIEKLKNPKSKVKIALVGKYVELQDAYKSIHEAIIHAGAVNECKVKIKYIHSEKLDKESIAGILKKYDGVIVAPGFGFRGLEGKLETVRFVRENKIPFFGICLGMQCAVIEYAKNVAGLEDANSTEMKSNPLHPVIDLMEHQKTVVMKGGTMRLGGFKCKVKEGTRAYEVYGNTDISERHRHRYELNNEYKKVLEDNGLIASGINPDNNLVEIIELKDHPWFVGVQFHPELKSTVANPHPLFVHFVKAALEYKSNRNSVENQEDGKKVITYS